MINFVICDDEIHMLDKLCNLFERAFVKIDFEAKIVMRTTNHEDIISYIASHDVNVVVLDIEFKGSRTNGLDIANKIRKINKDCYIIFTTSHFEYVMEAYHFKTFDYLIKNAITLDSLCETLSRLSEDIFFSKNNFLKIDNKGSLIDLNSIQFIEKRGLKIIYHGFHEDFEVYSTLSSVKDKLPENFIRCHKSFIANVHNIVNISFSTNVIYFKNNSSCYIGPAYKRSFMERINYESVFE